MATTYSIEGATPLSRYVIRRGIHELSILRICCFCDKRMLSMSYVCPGVKAMHRLLHSLRAHDLVL